MSDEVTIDQAQMEQAGWELVNFRSKEFRAVAEDLVDLGIVSGDRDVAVKRAQVVLQAHLGHLLPLIGMGEEFGELCHGVLKKLQGIRGTAAQHDSEIDDALGDIQVYGLSFCNRTGRWWAGSLLRVWARVKQRNWVANPSAGE